jgi:hypothetical protein
MRKNNFASIYVLAVALAILAGLISSTEPDALEKLIKALKLAHRTGFSVEPFVNYGVNAINHPTFPAVLLGIFGVLLIIFVFHSILHLKHVVGLLIRLMRAENRKDDVN